MIFSETHLKGSFVIDLNEIPDDRGFFARTFCARELEDHGLNSKVAQVNLSFNKEKGTLRGLHYQQAPAVESKFMRCISGAIFDVIVDLRSDSSTYLQHFGTVLSAENRRALYVPEMFAHGYLALSDDAQALYSASEFYTPGAEHGIRYNDPALGIQWPIEVKIVSEKDARWPLIEK